MADIDATALLQSEQHVAICAERGERPDLRDFPEAERVVRAAILRALLLGLPLEPHAESRVVRCGHRAFTCWARGSRGRST